MEGSDCASHPYEICDTLSKTCVHKGVFPIVGTEIAGYILIPLLFAVASVGGISGGLILLPLLIAMFQMTTKDSIAISSAITFSSALVRFVCFSSYAKHPTNAGETEINYSLVRAVFPVFMIGTYLGVTLSVSLGELPLATLIMILLTFLSFQVFYKAVKMFKKETQDMALDEGSYIPAMNLLETHSESTYMQRDIKKRQKK